MRSASSKCVVASTIARARVSGSSDLKMPEPTNTPSAPSCIISAASAGVDAAGGEVDDGQPSVLGHPAHELERCLVVLGGGRYLGLVAGGETPDVARDLAHVPHGFDYVA